MRFRPCIDFFRKGNRFLLTWSGKKKLNQIKITGTKIAYFFKLLFHLPNEEENPFPGVHLPGENVTEYQIWSRIFNFPYIHKRSPKKQEKYRAMEEKIKEYLEKEMSKKWINYPINKYDVFDTSEFFGGVPDGEEMDPTGKIISVLEIKTITNISSRRRIDNRFYYPPINYQLQLGLYLYLRGLDTGYLCICFLNPENWQNINTITLNTKLRSYSYSEETFSGMLNSWIDEIGNCPYEYTIVESYCNDFLSDNEIVLFKLKINIAKYEAFLSRIKGWFSQNKECSPTMLKEELSRLLNKHRSW